MTTYARRPWLRFGLGDGLGVAGFGAPVVVVLAAGVAAGFGAVPSAGAAGLVGVTPEADAVSPGVPVAGPVAEAGSVVKGVGSPGIGFARIPAIN